MSTVGDLDDGVDLAVAAYVSDGEWRVDEIAPNHLGDVEEVVEALRRFDGETGALAMIAVDEDFFLLVRVQGSDTQVLLSDVTAAEEWDLAASAIELLGLPMPEDDDDPEPVGDLELLADLGVSGPELADLLDDGDDEDLLPEDLLSGIARILGFGELFDDASGLTSA